MSTEDVRYKNVINIHFTISIVTNTTLCLQLIVKWNDDRILHEKLNFMI